MLFLIAAYFLSWDYEKTGHFLSLQVAKLRDDKCNIIYVRMVAL